MTIAMTHDNIGFQNTLSAFNFDHSLRVNYISEAQFG